MLTTSCLQVSLYAFPWAHIHKRTPGRRPIDENTSKLAQNIRMKPPWQRSTSMGFCFSSPTVHIILSWKEVQANHPSIKLFV